MTADPADPDDARGVHRLPGALDGESPPASTHLGPAPVEDHEAQGVEHEVVEDDEPRPDPDDPAELQGHPLLDVGDITPVAGPSDPTEIDGDASHAGLHLGLSGPLDDLAHPLDALGHPLAGTSDPAAGTGLPTAVSPGLGAADTIDALVVGAQSHELAALVPRAPTRTARASRWSGRDRERERELLRLVASLPPEDPERLQARDELVTMHLPLAHYLARRFRDRGEPLEDLQQVATIGLLKSVDRFSLDRGVEFSTFATPTIVGEIKRHFRDKGWAVRVPRRLQELRLSIATATNELSHTGQGSPTVAQIAAHLGISQDEVLEGLESAQAYAAISLDAASSDGDEENLPISQTLGGFDPGLGHVDNQVTVHPLLATLPPRERRIVELRFYHNMTQAQIAEQVGVSQMHVSRLLARSLAQLRQTMAE